MLMALTLYRHSHTSRPRDLPRAAGAQRSFSVYKSHFVPVTQKFTFHSHNNTNKYNMFRSRSLGRRNHRSVVQLLFGSEHLVI